jgi:F0F1-type ATP synthase delta subunit
MVNVSRRKLAAYAADELLAGQSLNEVAKKLAAVLIASKRQKQIEQLLQDVAWELENRGVVAQAQITSATVLTDNLRKLLQGYIKQNAKVKNVILDEQIDQSVIGGVRVETARHRWDQTLSTALKNIQEVF